MELYVIRHGQTDGNINNLMDGVRDIDLNATGITEAHKSEQLLKNEKFDLIICSPLIRTRHTLQIINTKNFPVQYDSNIIERDCGEYAGKSIYSLDKQKYWNYFDTTKYMNVEPIQKFFKRVYKFLDNLKILYSDKKILLVTHFGVTKAIHCYFNGIPKDGDLQNIGLKNCEVIKYIL